MEVKCPFLQNAAYFIEVHPVGSTLTPAALCEFGNVGIREGRTPRSVRCVGCPSRLIMRTDGKEAPALNTFGVITDLAVRNVCRFER